MKRFFLFFFFILFIGNVFALDSSYGSQINTESYTISRDVISRSVLIGEIFSDSIDIFNKGKTSMDVSFSLGGEISEIIESDTWTISIPSGNMSSFKFLVKGKSLGDFFGEIHLTGDIDYSVPVNISVVEKEPTFPILVNLDTLSKTFADNKKLTFQLGVNKIGGDVLENVSFDYSLIHEDNSTYFLGEESMNVSNSFQVFRDFDFPENAPLGEYVLLMKTSFDGEEILSKSVFILKKPFLKILILGVLPMWVLLLLLSLVIAGFITFYSIRRYIQSKQKYKMTLDVSSLPKKSEEFLYLGKIAEKNIGAYLDPHRLTTHCIVAGATGGGKSISAQVIIEEALLHNIAVIVFDPTAQWSGMLRKCTDKKMMSYYPKFGLKETDAKGFKGNVRQVQNARQLIDVNKYVQPGQIQIFSLNKLDPKDMDMFVANVVRQVFKSDPKEYPTLRVLLVFDEVHRLLSKFGGSGEGFLQIERACREFRKWGFGVMLVSQVLNDFVGEIKANISTEVQMRTRDEGDLNRIKTKYGEEFLQSLVKASVGVGMFVNPAYNRAQPYFVNFRPILHNTRRLSDEELEKYNKYNDIVDDLEFSINELEKLKIDTFDLKMELKLVKDKIMGGNFSVVEIYLEGLTPRVKKEWEKLGKPQPKRTLELVSEEEIKASIAEAKKAKEKADAAEKKTEKKEEVPKESLEDKQVTPLTFDNGLMVGSLKELKDVLPNLDDEVFKIHVNETKNDIADWISKIAPADGNRLKGVLDKPSMIAGLANVGKPKEEPKKEDKK